MGAIIEYPDITTLSNSELTELFLVHIFTMINTGRQLIEEFHDALLSESEIFASPSIVIISCLESHLECTSVEGMSDFSYGAELESIALCYRIECGRTSKRAQSSLNPSLAMFLSEEIANLRERELIFILCEGAYWMIIIFTIVAREEALSVAKEMLQIGDDVACWLRE